MIFFGEGCGSKEELLSDQFCFSSSYNTLFLPIFISDYLELTLAQRVLLSCTLLCCAGVLISMFAS